MIERTKDYSKFKFLDCNRELSKTKVEELVRNIHRKNLLHLKPIQVDKNFGIIDGQHRLKAAEHLGVDIYYEKSDSMTKEDMLVLNAVQTKWRMEDFQNFFVQEGYVEYTKLHYFCQNNHCSLKMALSMLGLDSRRKEACKAFKEGKFIFDFDEKEGESKIEIALEAFDMIQQYSFEKYKWHHNLKYFIAITRFVSIPAVDKKLFMKKLKLAIDKVRPCVTRLQAIEMFKNIYNYRNQNPVSIKDLDIGYWNVESE